ncbi:MAG: 50S ribosomal protein L23 [Chromatiaceae bacterium]|nr:50S ribosomal protein L23 [Gammaproteobacteria bacterium]MCP5426967.1 50S ribosomal protein L23 [Chromatiaceae bacterium]MCB1861203.1 50S ribosomal protein L23 [Gammaproteobacteria bacterium]MCB1871094.1 50S ribosomal protein L23 [Gammaproteobacteria bacterium]MCB1878863.1 50S ribosomal protein L23 [Gammaproteobacteria bacterium]
MNNDRLMQVLVTPVVSEKSTVAADSSRQFVFHVLPDASKPEIRKAVEMMFDVKVDAVRVVNIKGKHKRFGRLMGRRNNIRKAYVKLAEGSDIDFGGIA